MLQIKKMRMAAGLTQAELAAKVGITRSAVALWETGRKYPRGKDIPIIANVLNCSIDELYEQDFPERADVDISQSST